MLVEVTRGDRLESVHRGSVAVTSPDGRVVASVGDPGQFVFLLGRGSALDLDRSGDEEIKSAIAHVLATAADLTPNELASKQGRQANSTCRRKNSSTLR